MNTAVLQLWQKKHNKKNYFRGILNLDVQTGSGFEQIFKTSSESGSATLNEILAEGCRTRV